MPLVEFEPAISGGERPKTYALDRAATGTGGKREGEASSRLDRAIVSFLGPGVENLSASILRVNLVHENKFIKYWSRCVIMDSKG
jgi:hypothetical protein